MKTIKGTPTREDIQNAIKMATDMYYSSWDQEVRGELYISKEVYAQNSGNANEKYFEKLQQITVSALEGELADSQTLEQIRYVIRDSGPVIDTKKKKIKLFDEIFHILAEVEYKEKGDEK